MVSLFKCPECNEEMIMEHNQTPLEADYLHVCRKCRIIIIKYNELAQEFDDIESEEGRIYRGH